MGTRADFYVGRGESAEWLGSIAWDGYPAGLYDTLRFSAETEEAWRQSVAATLSQRDDATTPEKGWPWPWDDSATTDYAYAFDGGKVHASNFGGSWFVVEPEGVDFGEPDEGEESGPPATFPDMSARKDVTYGKRSGVIIVGAQPPEGGAR
jgi:hypothetical protein